MENTHDTGDWRPLLAALANDDARSIYAQIVLGASPSLEPSKQATKRTGKALRLLLRAKLVVEEDGVFEAPADALLRALEAGAPARKTGVDRFLNDGRIVQYPAQPAEREELLRWVAGQTLADGETLDERDMTERLRRFHEDPAGLRRYLVDFALIERTRSGSEYRRATDARRSSPEDDSAI
ncbi:DUF2087 domain-containing protein [Plantibacter sp. VKM Ac-2880]|uniref:DUF2087 domain-containing protein n=1 Tax=Plantibacter sp. VKM Ac-2880 TaxID=2783827 RepID=UPI00189048B4|nr:DUF2087 domain-containing protein [Plantibacter sp. VKM Ac-2880]MBF4569104.1 DUF2087 domain-containing protein [Plantibacter sp. VKM Ac-2880]